MNASGIRIPFTELPVYNRQLVPAGIIERFWIAPRHKCRETVLEEPGASGVNQICY